MTQRTPTSRTFAPFTLACTLSLGIAACDKDKPVDAAAVAPSAAQVASAAAPASSALDKGKVCIDGLKALMESAIKEAQAAAGDRAKLQAIREKLDAAEKAPEGIACTAVEKSLQPADKKAADAYAEAQLGPLAEKLMPLLNVPPPVAAPSVSAGGSASSSAMKK